MTKKLTIEQKIQNLLKVNNITGEVKIITTGNNSGIVSTPSDKIVKPPKSPKKVVQKTNVVLVLDKSCSMINYKDKAQESVNNWINTIKNSSSGQEVSVSYLYFADAATPKLTLTSNLVNDKETPKLTYANPDGWTALRDGIKEALKDIGPEVPNTTNLVMVITDGLENRSVTSHEECRNLIEKFNKRSDTTIAFMVPTGHAYMAINLGALASNVTEWVLTKEGLADVSVRSCNSVSKYFELRSKGVAPTQDFYQPDLSNISSKNITKEFTALDAKSFRLINASAEGSISEIVSKSTRSPYLIGNSYYQLLKKEKVQPSKLVLIRDRTTGVVYADNDARKIIGLPTGKYITVAPGNHGNYDVYIQSTSTNRIIPRGTSVITLLK